MSRVIAYVRRHHVGLAALFVAMGGSAYAAATIGPDDIERNAVRGRHIAPNQVTGGDTREGSLEVAQIVARVRSSADVEAPQAPTRAAYPLGERGRTYTQRKGQIDEPRGYVEVFFPAGCLATGGAPFGSRGASVHFFRQGEDLPFAVGTVSSFGTDGGNEGDDTLFGGITAAFTPSSGAPPPFEAATTRRATIRAEVESFCDPASTARPVVRSVKLDLLGLR